MNFDPNGEDNDDGFKYNVSWLTENGNSVDLDFNNKAEAIRFNNKLVGKVIRSDLSKAGQNTPGLGFGGCCGDYSWDCS